MAASINTPRKKCKMKRSVFTEFSGTSLDSRRQNAYKITHLDEVEDISYEDFLINYLMPNKPCLFTAKLSNSWESRTNWVQSDGSPNFIYLKTLYGEATVPVANCQLQEYSSHPKQDMKMLEYIDYWQLYRSMGYPASMPCLYLKDWHFTKAFPDAHVYSTPIYFGSDWLNEFWDTLPQDGYRFVYMGPKGTWTPFHSDVYRSFSWSANICGKKKWIFYPPGCEEHLKDRYGHLVYDLGSSSLQDPVMYPNAYKVKGQAIEVIQGQGQIVFVPSGWHHQVYNLEDTISINHNWLNGCNVDLCWRHLQESLEEVQREISDCRGMDGWSEQCQLILNASAGIDYRTFVNMLTLIAERRLEIVRKHRPLMDLQHSQCSCAENKCSKSNCNQSSSDQSKCSKGYCSQTKCSEGNCSNSKFAQCLHDESNCTKSVTDRDLDPLVDNCQKLDLNTSDCYQVEHSQSENTSKDVIEETRETKGMRLSGNGNRDDGGGTENIIGDCENEANLVNYRSKSCSLVTYKEETCDTKAEKPDVFEMKSVDELYLGTLDEIGGHILVSHCGNHARLKHNLSIDFELYDLFRIRDVLQCVVQDNAFQEMDQAFVDSTHELLNKVADCLSNFEL